MLAKRHNYGYLSCVVKSIYMKKISTLIILFVLAAASSFAQTVYTVNTDRTYGADCSNCTFNISSGVTLSFTSSGTCTNCTFNGGNIAVKSTVTCQPCSFNNNNIAITGNNAINPNSGTTSFNNTVLTVAGNGSIFANTPVNISNSTFTFNGNGFFYNNGGTLDVSNSTLNFFGNAYFNANAGPVNLRNASRLVVGNGTLSSLAYIKMNGPALNIYDAASSIVLGNYNNYYYNWSSYNSISNSKTYTTTYPSAASTMNCGGAGQNACGMWSMPAVYGPATANSTGVSAMSALLPVVLAGFTIANHDSYIQLNWQTSQEINSHYFFIERSANGHNFERIGTVNAKGNSAIPSNYSYSDYSPLQGITYYRLVMVDLDGTTKYSAILTTRSAVSAAVSVFPNPTVDMVNIALSNNTSGVTVKLLNQGGQVLLEQKAAANSTLVSLNVQSYPRGMYVVKITSQNGTEQTAKLMVAH